MLRYRHPVAAGPSRTLTTDVCVYGGTSAGIAAAVAARRAGRTAVVAAFGRHLGGMSAAGLGMTDTGDTAVIGGLARELYDRVGGFRFEPHVAERAFEDWVEGIPVHRDQHLVAVRHDGDRIAEIELEGGLRIRAAYFVDASYEGDLLAKAGATWTAGREGNDVYGETLNGIQFHETHQFRVPVDGRGVEGVTDEPPGEPGTGDRRIQAYCFRLCLTQAPDRRPFPRPPGYHPDRYELLRRSIEAGVFEVFGNNQPMPNGKTDMNSHGAVATDHVGANHAWPDADYETRERIFQDHVAYQQGLLHFLANDLALPEEVTAEAGSWGLPRDEFPGTGGWPHELYVREARRLVADHVVTEHDCRGARTVDDPVALASYGMDSHNCRRILVDGRARNEGNVEVDTPAPYAVPYRAIVPRTGECPNLLVPVCLSASHIAYGSIRMEPVFMELGQAAGTAASLALDRGDAVQDVEYRALRERLLRDGAVLDSS
jgi:hypothetical protein